jgi:hypothetical protein
MLPAVTTLVSRWVHSSLNGVVYHPKDVEEGRAAKATAKVPAAPARILDDGLSAKSERECGTSSGVTVRAGDPSTLVRNTRRIPRRPRSTAPKCTLRCCFDSSVGAACADAAFSKPPAAGT